MIAARSSAASGSSRGRPGCRLRSSRARSAPQSPDELGVLHLAGHVPKQAVVPRDDDLGRPPARLDPEDPELDRQPRRLPLGLAR